MSVSLIRTAAAAVALSVAPLAAAHAQDAFAPAAAGSGAEVPGVAVLEVAGAPPGSMHTHLVRHHPTWMMSIGKHDTPNRKHVVVYRDGVAIGGVEALRAIRAADVVRVQRLSRREAARRLGADHPAGALMLTSR